MTDITRRLLACALLMCMMVCVFACLAAMPAEAADVRATDWMSAVPGSTKLSNMSIPGTHDSCTQNVDMRYIFQCQDASIATQLKYGSRYLDMRLVLEKRSGQAQHRQMQGLRLPVFQNAHAGGRAQRRLRLP